MNSPLVSQAQSARAKIHTLGDMDEDSTSSDPCPADDWNFLAPKASAVLTKPAEKPPQSNELTFMTRGTLVDMASEQEAIERATLSLHFKIVVIGDMGVGKTTLIAALLRPRNETMFDARLLQKRESTLGVDFVVMHRLLRDVATKTSHELFTHTKVQIWDTAGQERFRSIMPGYTRNSNAIFFVFDLTKEKSLYSFAGSWKDTVCDARENNDELLVVLVGTKSDCDRAISKETIADYARQHKIPFVFECTALRRSTVHDILDFITLALSENERRQSIVQLNRGAVLVKPSSQRGSAIDLENRGRSGKSRCRPCA